MRRKSGEWPLVFFSSLTQMSVVAFLTWSVYELIDLERNLAAQETFSKVLLGVVFAGLILGGLSATLHLGSIFNARYVLSRWRKSSLSQEALLSGFFGMVVFALLCLHLFGVGFENIELVLTFLGIITGAALVLVIGKLYRLRTVPAWSYWGTTASFLLTSLLAGISLFGTVWMALVLWGRPPSAEFLAQQLSGLNTVIVGLILAQAVLFLQTSKSLTNRGGAAEASAKRLGRELGWIVLARWSAAGVGLIILVFAKMALIIIVAYLFVIASEIIGRYLFYAFHQRAGL